MAKIAKQRQHPPKLDHVNIKEAQQPPTPIDLALATDKAQNAPDTRTSPDPLATDPQKTLPLADDEIRKPPGPEVPPPLSRKTPRVVHLPPKEVQEERAKEVERAQESLKRKEKKEDERLSLSVVAGGPTEAASSPSSTVGAHSTFTPRPTHNSPDTSPDTGMSVDGAENVDPEGVSSPTTLSTTREHQERVIQAQIESTDKVAPDAVPGSPDTQLRLEEEQAIRSAQDAGDHDVKQPPELATKTEDSVNDGNAIETESKGTSQQPLVNGDAPSQSAALDGTIIKDDGSHPGKDTDSVDPCKTIQGQPYSCSMKPNANVQTGQDSVEDIEMKDVSPSKDDLTTPKPPTSPCQERSQLRRPTTPNNQQHDESPLAMSKSSQRILSTESPQRQRKCSMSSPRHPLDQSRLSGIVFAKPLAATMDPAVLSNPGYAALAGAAEEGHRDYLVPLFTYQAHIEQQRGARVPPPEERKFKGQGQPLQSLIAVANKTCNTSNFHVTIRENQENRILKRIYHLQNANRWALRQLERCEEPHPDETFLDHLLLQMKAMRTDFREERKLKLAIAADLAYSCAEWHAASPEERIALQINVKKVPQRSVVEDSQDSQGQDVSQPTPDLIPSGATETDVESVQDDDLPLLHLTYAEPAAALFTKDFNTTTLDIAATSSTNDLFAELPFYEPTLIDPPVTKEDIPAVSKYVASKIVSTATGPPRKRSRYDYEPEDRTDDPDYPTKRPSTGTSTSGHATPMTPGFLSRKGGLEPEMTNVALFAPSNRHLLKRLHDTHAFRPPSEFPMPSTAFLAARLPSQWTWEEDQKLRQLVKDYSYNWSLISDELRTKSTLESQADRRTPWECFERWAGLEGLPQEMHKTSYFKTWFSRLDAASAQVERQQRLQQSQPGSATPGHSLQHTSINGIQGRKRHRVPIRIEKKHNSRYIYIMNGIVRRMRKAEAAAHKQQENAKAAQMRKNQAHNDAGMAGAKQTKLAATPQELSKIRADRDAKLKEKAEQYRQQMELQRVS